VSWTRFLLRRLAYLVASLFILSAIVFTMMEVIPGDLAHTILGQFATEDQLHALRAQLGLDKPPLVRYGEWLGGAVTGDLGYSITLHTPVAPLLLQRARNTFLVAIVSITLGMSLATFLGFVAGLRRPPWLDQPLSGLAVFLGSLPDFLIALPLILLFSYSLRWLPSTSLDAADAPLQHPAALVLPVLTLVLGMMGYNLRLTRASVARVVESEFVITAELKRLPARTIVSRHIAPNALLPTITVIGAYLGAFVSGLVIVESVFAFPGLGLLILNAAKDKDVPLLVGAVLFVAAFRMIFNLGADVLYRVVDPRVQLS
jgi:peptide/nickel transport system permease protein